LEQTRDYDNEQDNSAQSVILVEDQRLNDEEEAIKAVQGAIARNDEGADEC
jgi:hypothetical protein